MSLSRVIARPLLASVFVVGGVDTFRHPARRADVSADVAVQLARRLGLPEDPELLVRINAAAQVGAGTLLALGKFRRLSALVLMASLLPTTYAGHRFWEVEDPERRKQQQMHFLKNLGLLGGLLLEAVDTEGRPSLAWRSRRAARGAAVVLGDAAGHLNPVSSGDDGKGRRRTPKAAAGMKAGRRQAKKAGRRQTRKAQRQARSLRDAAARQAAQASAVAARQAAQARKAAAEQAVKAGRRATEQAAAARRAAEERARAARRAAGDLDAHHLATTLSQGAARGGQAAVHAGATAAGQVGGVLRDAADRLPVG
ncbi:MAG TPA: DoxX family protein [Acidimicrobiales bacterium]|nr:DoxX family protein [Acidimicrobiales bacterium]